MRPWSAKVHKQPMQASLFVLTFKLEQPHMSAVFLSIVNKKFPAQLHKVA